MLALFTLLAALPAQAQGAPVQGGPVQGGPVHAEPVQGGPGASARAIECIATMQCRGDALRMCAPSVLTIRVEGQRMWIARQGPFAARPAEGALVVDAFGPAYRLSIAPDGAFLYTGNRGKRFTGRCAEVAP